MTPAGACNRCGIVTILLMLQGIGCQRSQPNMGLPTAQMQLGSQTFTLEIANSDSTRQRGLMKRDSMAADHGMIFVFVREHQNGFWMKNTRIGLDIIFVDANGVIVGIKQMKPYDLTSTTSPKPYKWAIELNKGTSATAGIKVGDAVKIPDVARDAVD